MRVGVGGGGVPSTHECGNRVLHSSCRQLWVGRALPLGLGCWGGGQTPHDHGWCGRGRGGPSGPTHRPPVSSVRACAKPPCVVRQDSPMAARQTANHPNYPASSPGNLDGSRWPPCSVSKKHNHPDERPGRVTGRPMTIGSALWAPVGPHARGMAKSMSELFDHVRP